MARMIEDIKTAPRVVKCPLEYREFRLCCETFFNTPVNVRKSPAFAVPNFMKHGRQKRRKSVSKNISLFKTGRIPSDRNFTEKNRRHLAARDRSGLLPRAAMTGWLPPYT